MKLDVLPSRNDFEPVVAMLHSLGWTTKTIGNFVEVSPSPDSPPVLVSAFSYLFCGIWLRPIYAKVDLETYIDLDIISSALLMTSLEECGSIAVMNANKRTKEITISYRLLIPSEPSEKAFLFEGILSASLSGADLEANLKRIHERVQNGEA